MDWNIYKTILRSNLSTWFQQVRDIQSKSFGEDELLFQLNENILDAFSAMVDSYSSNESINEWLEKEKVRQKQKSLQTKMGDLHEIMIRSLKPSIQKQIATPDPKTGNSLRIYDLYDDTNNWIAEIKNKHNTTKGEDRKASFDKLKKGLSLKENGYTAYYITIIRGSHNKVNSLFTPSDNTSGSNLSDSKIKHVDGETFYEMITSDPDGLSKAFDCLKDLLKEEFRVSSDDDELLGKIKSLTLFKTKVNINTAGIEALCYLPGIGKSTAELIIHSRNEKLFSYITDIQNIKGIGKVLYSKVESYIEV
jgi:competence ComEA-like helix-hairpin-helix protein